MLNTTEKNSAFTSQSPACGARMDAAQLIPYIAQQERALVWRAERKRCERCHNDGFIIYFTHNGEINRARKQPGCQAPCRCEARLFELRFNDLLNFAIAE